MDKLFKVKREDMEDVIKFKISIIGDMGTGKTCLSLRFVKDLFTDTHKATISDIETKGLNIQGNRVVFQIWDTAGQERFRSLLPLYMKGIDGAIVVYDVTDKVTYDHLNEWVTQIRKYAEANTVIMVIGNKIDLDEERKQVPAVEAEAWCKSHDILFYEASAKTGENVDKLFMSLGEEMIGKANQKPCRYVYCDSASMSIEKEGRMKCC